MQPRYYEMLRSNKGFTLIEMMIVVVILGIIAAIAYPSYQESVRRANRVEGQALLNDAAARQERFYSQNYKYATTIAALYNETTKNSETGKYTLGLSTESGDGGYTLTANAQFNDAKCGDLGLNAVGDKTKTGSEDVEYCWR